MIKRIPILIAVAATLAACGSSKAPGIVQAPGGGATAAPATSTTTTSTSTTSTSTTPLPAALNTKPVISLPKGAPPKTLVSKDLVAGTGPAATASSTVTVNYVGVLYKNGTEFDSSWKRGQPATFSLSGVIKGWTQGIPGMKVGGRRELIIPPDLAYGKTGSPPTIGPNETLVFVIDLRSIS
jgi:peptidylprolyl isomerase